MAVQKLDRKRLIEMLSKNPDLPIIAEVYSEVVADDGFAYWFGDVKESCYVDTLWAGEEQIWSFDLISRDYNEMIYFMDCEFPEKIQSVSFRGLCGLCSRRWRCGSGYPEMGTL